MLAPKIRPVSPSGSGDHNPAKFWFTLRAAAEHVFATDSEIGLIVDQDILGRSPPQSTRYWIGDFGRKLVSAVRSTSVEE
jgi:hypothetical protein